MFSNLASNGGYAWFSWPKKSLKSAPRNWQLMKDCANRVQSSLRDLKLYVVDIFLCCRLTKLWKVVLMNRFKQRSFSFDKPTFNEGVKRVLANALAFINIWNNTRVSDVSSVQYYEIGTWMPERVPQFIQGLTKAIYLEPKSKWIRRCLKGCAGYGLTPSLFNWKYSIKGVA